MSLTTDDLIAAIASHSAGFARAARAADLRARVEHCPDWDVADLVHHLTDVHWFWATIAGERLNEPPDESRRPARAPDDGLVDAFEAGAAHLVETLRTADQSAHCWTWAGWKQDVAFVTRHQVQEAAVHHWDAAHAAGTELGIEPDVAADSVDEFLHFSVASEDDPDDPVKPPLRGTLVYRASDTGGGWTLNDGTRPGTAKVARAVADGAPVIEATASDLLLWLYGRVELDTSTVPEDLVARFRDICFTD